MGSKVVLLLRNAVFFCLIFCTTMMYGLCAIFIMHSYMASKKAAFIWLRSIFLASKYIVGVKYKIHNVKLVKSRGVIIACNHCSAWETFFLAYYFDIPVFILKKSLFHLPLIGLFLRTFKMIGIDRNSYSKKHREAIIHRTQYALDHKRNIVIFPQGTRVPTEETYNYDKYPFKSGIAIFAAGNKVITSSTNARQYFGKGLFSFKKPGTIQIKFNELMEFSKKATKEDMIGQVRESIEKGCKQLCDIQTKY